MKLVNKKYINTTKFDCPVCAQTFSSRGIVKHIVDFSNISESHCQFLKQQVEIIDEYYYSEGRIKDLLNDDRFYLGYDSVKRISDEKYSKNWISKRQSKQKTLKCTNCQKEFKTYRNPKTPYCSKECETSISKKKIFTCKECMEIFSAYTRSKEIGRKFCSLGCYERNQRSRNQNFICRVCNENFKRLVSSLKTNENPRYCSLKCSESEISQFIKLGNSFQRLVLEMKVALGEQSEVDFLYNKKHKESGYIPDFQLLKEKDTWIDIKLSKKSLIRSDSLKYLNCVDKLIIYYLIESSEYLEHPKIEYVNISKFFSQLKQKKLQDIVEKFKNIRTKYISRDWNLDTGTDDNSINYWTYEEIEKLRDIYSSADKEKILKALPSRTWKAILSQVAKQKINRKLWTEDEVKILKEIYPTGNNKEIMKALSGKTLSAIQTKAYNLKIGFKKWFIEELEILKKYYPTHANKEICKKLPNRTQHTIVSRASILGIKKQFREKGA